MDSLQKKLWDKKKKKKILFMPHLVLGYPDFQTNQAQIELMIKADADIIELQFPFSEPVADGPILARANLQSLKNGTKVEQCFIFAESLKQKFPQVDFLLMTYGNIPFQMGMAKFLHRSWQAGIKAILLPDFPLEEAEEYRTVALEKGIAPIFIFAPNQKKERRDQIAFCAQGFIYCTSRKGVTGMKTAFDQNLQKQLKEYKTSTSLPLAVGFGLSSVQDLQFLIGHAEMAVIGSKLLEVLEEKGLKGLDSFLESLKQTIEA